MSSFEMFLIWFNLILLNVYVIIDCLSSTDIRSKIRNKKKKKNGDKNED